MPDMSTIVRHFGSWRKYRQEVFKLYEAEQSMQAKLRARKLADYVRLLDHNKLPEVFRQLPDDELLAAAAKFLVVDRLGPNLTADEKIELSLTPSDLFAHSLHRTQPRPTTSAIELTAHGMQVFDDIWPLEEDISHLKVSPPA